MSTHPTQEVKRSWMKENTESVSCIDALTLYKVSALKLEVM